MTGIYLKKIELTKEHLNKEMVQSLQVPRNEYYMPKYFQINDEKHPNKHILVFKRSKHHTSFFFQMKKAANSVLQSMKNERATFIDLQNM